MPSEPVQSDKLSPEQLELQDAAGLAEGRRPDSDGLPPSTPRVVTMPPTPPRSDGPLWWRLVGVILTIRPHQWVKNVFVLAPIVFAKEIFDLALLTSAALAFVVFCLLAGAVYTINDITDVQADRLHPVKRYRPIASGRVPVAYAWLLAVLLVGLSFAGAAQGPLSFLFVVGGYFFLNLAYTFKLKHVAYVDVGCIATGFVLRVMGGGFATHIDVSKYLLACTALLALFLGFGKRRHELAGMAWKGGRQRVSLEGYTRVGLDVALGVTATATVVTYVAYTLDEHTRVFFRSDWLWVSGLFVVLGVLRFLHLVRSRPRAESPTQEMLRDGPFVGIMLGWIVLVMWMVYNLRPTP
jgi:decaprenyl-phosphate phosphoribosyltransferase